MGSCKIIIIKMPSLLAATGVIVGRINCQCALILKEKGLHGSAISTFSFYLYWLMNVNFYHLQIPCLYVLRYCLFSYISSQLDVPLCYIRFEHQLSLGINVSKRDWWKKWQQIKFQFHYITCDILQVTLIKVPPAKVAESTAKHYWFVNIVMLC